MCMWSHPWLSVNCGRSGGVPRTTLGSLKRHSAAKAGSTPRGAVATSTELEPANAAATL